jgi:hypothetical protein
MQKISRDIPLDEVTIRRYEKPTVKGRELVRKLCLSLGLLQPGDSRDVIIDILSVMLWAKKPLLPDEIEKWVVKERERHGLEMLGITSSNILRQLRRLKVLFLVEKIKTGYRMTENMNLSGIFEEKIEKLLIAVISQRVLDYCRKVDEEFGS